MFLLPRWFRRRLDFARLKDESYRFLFEPGPADEAVAIDCETTGLDPRKDDIVSVAAIRIRKNRILTSERFVETIRPAAAMSPEAIKIHRLRHADVAVGRTDDVVIPEFLRFIGGRPLVGYYVAFDIAMLDKHVRRLLGFGLPNPAIEVSGLYFERKYAAAPPGVHVDLSFNAMVEDLKLPMLDQHDAYADALMSAMMYLALRDLKERGVQLKRKPLSAAPHF